jgi:diguanylate cyclase (GGDEF)-like protein
LEFRKTIIKDKSIQDLILEAMNPFIGGVKSAFNGYMGVNLKLDKAGIKFSKELKTKYSTIACIPFSGAITGEFFILVNLDSCIEHFSHTIETKSSDPIFKRLLLSSLKEIINIAAAQAMSSISEIFGPVTLLAPRLIEGKLHYPSTFIYSAFMEDTSKRFTIEAKASFDLMEMEIQVENERLKRESRLDDAGLFNRKYFNEFMAKMEKRYQSKGVFSIIFADINRLKYVNDNFGHNYGDQYIKSACEIIKHSCRSTDHCFRIGGDEIVVFMFDCSKENAQYALDKIGKLLLTEQIVVNVDGNKSKEISISISLGLASNSEGLAFQDILRIADERMEKNKREWYEKNGYERRT